MNPAKRKLRAIERFWNLVKIKGRRDCWIWKGKPDKFGYAQTYWEGRLEMVHRVALSIHEDRKILSPTRRLNQGEVVRHSCDTRLCCNPNHLLSGTQADNIKDRDQRNRTCRGEHRPASKLTDGQVREIRRKFIPRRYGLKRLAKEFDMNFTTIDAIVKRKAWKHVK